MSFTKNQSDRAAASVVVSTPGCPRVIEREPHGAPCEHDPQARTERPSAALSTTSPGVNQQLGSQVGASREAGVRQNPRGKNSTASRDVHKLHEEVQTTDQGSSLRVYVTDTEAESMICHNGSVEEISDDSKPFESTQLPTTCEIRSLSFFVTPPPPAEIMAFTEGLFYAGLCVDRTSRIRHVLAQTDNSSLQ